MAFGEFDVDRIIRPLKNKIFNFIGRCILKAIDNTGTTQTVQVTGMKDEVISDIERMQEYGFDSYPNANAEAVVLFPNGNRDQGICIKVHDRDNRPSGLNAGDVVMYDTSGNQIVCRNGGVIEIQGNGGILEFAVLASLLVAKINSEVMAKYNSHTHGGVVAAPAITMINLTDTDIQSSKIKVS